MATLARRTGAVEHGVAVRAAAGERDCGDRAVTVATDQHVLLGVIDGLGHGPAAADAADRAAAVLEQHADEPCDSLLQRCHTALRGTRGAAITLVAVGVGTARWVAVGNVRAVVCRVAGGTTRLVTRGGVVGMRLPRIRVGTVPIGSDDLVLLFTDGVDEAVVDDVAWDRAPTDLAPRLLERRATGSDDALVLVARRATAPR